MLDIGLARTTALAGMGFGGVLVRTLNNAQVGVGRQIGTETNQKIVKRSNATRRTRFVLNRWNRRRNHDGIGHGFNLGNGQLAQLQVTGSADAAMNERLIPASSHDVRITPLRSPHNPLARSAAISGAWRIPFTGAQTASD